MMAYQYANIEKYLHGISFKGGSHMPWRQGLLARFAIWPAYLKQAGDRPEPRIERLVKKQIQVMAAKFTDGGGRIDRVRQAFRENGDRWRGDERSRVNSPRPR
jgi:hypothetical protein